MNKTMHTTRLIVIVVALTSSVGTAACRQASRETPPAASSAITAPAAEALDVQFVATPAGPGSLEPQVTVSSRGLLVSWVERQGQKATLKFAERTSDGWTPTRTVASGNNWFVSHADVPNVMRLRDGTVVANWLVETDATIEAYNLLVSYSRDDGVTWARPFMPHHDKTTTQHGFASFFELPDAFGLVWLDGRAQELDTTSPEGGAMSIRSATFDRAWKQTTDAAVDLRVCECCSTTVAVTAEGPITAFRDRSDKEVRDIAVSRLENNSWTAAQTVHNDGWTIPACPVNGPMLSAKDRAVAVAWFTMQNEQGHAFAAFSSDAGRSWGSPIRLDENTALGYVDVELLDNGSALATWVEARPQQTPEVRIRRIEASGMKGASVVVAGASGGRPTGSPHFARSGDEILLAWTESAPPAGDTTEGVLQVKTAVARVPQATAVK